MTPLFRRLAVLLGLLAVAAFPAQSQTVSGTVVQGVGPAAVGQTGAAMGVIVPAQSSASGAPLAAVAPAGDPASMVTLEGRVVNALTGQPLRQANVTVLVLPSGPAVAGDRPLSNRNWGATSDAAGNFQFENLPPGSYILTGEKSGYVRQQYNANAGPQGGGPPLIGSPGEAIRDIEFKLMPQGILSGSVVDENGEPVANASIQVLKVAAYFRRTQNTSGGSSNDVGEFLIGGLAPGKYLIRAENRSGVFGNAPEPAITGRGARESYVPTFYPSATNIDTAATITVAAGQRVNALEILLQRGQVFSVSGQVVGMEPQSADAPRVQVSLRPQTQDALAPRPLGQTTIALNGEFEIRAVQPGSYYLTATQLKQGSPPQLAAIPVTVANSNVEGITISAAAAPPMQVSGTVKVEGEENVRLAMNILLQPISGVPFGGPPAPPGKVQGDGSFQINNVLPGRYIVNVGGIQPGSFVKEIRAGAGDILTGGLDLTQPQAVAPLGIVIGRNPAKLSGVVLEGDQPKPRAYVTLLPEPMRPEARQLMRNAVSDANGFFQMIGIAPGAYRLYAWTEPVLVTSLQPDDLKPYEAESVTVSFDEGDAKQVNLSLIEPQ